MLGTPVDLNQLTTDAYVVAGIADHISPWQACYRSARMLGVKNARFVLSSSGHIASLVNPPGNPRASYHVGDVDEPDPAFWAESAEQHTDSWWPDFVVLARRAQRQEEGRPRRPGRRWHGSAGARSWQLRPGQVMTGRAAARTSVEELVPVLGQQIRIVTRRGVGVPLVLCNGIGASLEVLDPLVGQLNPDTTIVRFDVPGTGASPNSPLPYGFPYLAVVLGRLLCKLDIDGQVDILGLSWGGALAQQFAFQNPRHCRRLILVATGTGALMVPGRPAVLAKMLTPRRFLDHEYAALLAGDLYGGSVRHDPSVVKRLFDRQLMAGSRVGYLHQLLAGSVWTSLFALPLIRQRTLIIAGLDDPIVPVANARIIERLLPHATVDLHRGGHIDLITNVAEIAPVIERFRSQPD